jgi:peptidoglycan/LPS O-acetylase OafA/YrhL
MRETTSNGYLDRKNFEYLRWLLASLVIFSHCFSLDGQRDPLERVTSQGGLGGLAVDAFFLISGYLITQSWLSDPSVSRYLGKRILRIVPAFFVASIFAVFIAGPLGASASQYFNELSIVNVLRDAITLRDPHTPPVFMGTVVGTVNGAMWTISFEFRCYLAVLVLELLRVYRSRVVLVILAIVTGLYACIAVPVPGPTDSQHYVFGLHALKLSDWMLWFFALFLSGSCFYVWRDRIRFHPAAWLVSLVILGAGLFHYETVRPAFLLAGAYVVFGAASSPLLRPRGSLAQVDRSYGLYLYGWPVTKLANWYIPSLDPLSLFVATYVIAFALATLSWRLIEAPALKLKPGRRTKINSEANGSSNSAEAWQGAKPTLG